MKPTHWTSSRGPTRPSSLGLHFLESYLELCGPCLYQRSNSLEYKQMNASGPRQRFLLPYRFHRQYCNLYHRNLEFDFKITRAAGATLFYLSACVD